MYFDEVVQQVRHRRQRKQEQQFGLGYPSSLWRFLLTGRLRRKLLQRSTIDFASSRLLQPASKILTFRLAEKNGHVLHIGIGQRPRQLDKPAMIHRRTFPLTLLNAQAAFSSPRARTGSTSTALLAPDNSRGQVLLEFGRHRVRVHGAGAIQAVLRCWPKAVCPPPAPCE